MWLSMGVNRTVFCLSQWKVNLETAPWPSRECSSQSPLATQGEPQGPSITLSIDGLPATCAWCPY